MTPYRSPAPKHVCTFDVTEYRCCHYEIRRCTCGERAPLTLAERQLEQLDTLAAHVARMVSALAGR